MIHADSSLIDIAFEVCDALDRAGIVAVLCGGSAAAYYCSTYQSYDADFVLRFETHGRDIDAALGAIGFTRDAGNVYGHSAVDFTVEFPRGPLAIGRKLVDEWRTERRGEQTLHVVSPEDSICDRFLHYWAWRDTSARALALEIARNVKRVDVEAITAWAELEIATDSLYDTDSWKRFASDLRDAVN